jgi:ubiquinone/menaquinone biosynthesis C-methylase UbiE
MGMNRNFFRIVFCVFVIWISLPAHSQEKQEIKSYTIDGIDTLVDIGCGNGIYDRLIAHIYPDMFLVLEDVEKDANGEEVPKALAKTIRNSKYAPAIEQRSRFVLGTADSIPLASNTYKYVLCRKTLHEFENHTKMVSELSRILARGGVLILVERQPKRKGEVDKYCKKRYLSREEVIESFTELRLFSVETIKYRDGKLNVFHFKKP